MDFSFLTKEQLQELLDRAQDAAEMTPKVSRSLSQLENQFEDILAEFIEEHSLGTLSDQQVNWLFDVMMAEVV